MCGWPNLNSQNARKSQYPCAAAEGAGKRAPRPKRGGAAAAAGAQSAPGDTMHMPAVDDGLAPQLEKMDVRGGAGTAQPAASASSLGKRPHSPSAMVEEVQSKVTSGWFGGFGRRN